MEDMVYKFKLPDSGEGIAESEIISWHVQPGDYIKEDDTLLEIQSDKAVVELPSPVSGMVKRLLFEEGDVPKVGDDILEIEVAGIQTQEEGTIVTELKETEHVEPVSEIKTIETKSKFHSPYNVNGVDIRLLATPSNRRYARENNVDLTKVTPTGKNRRISREDIDLYIQTRGRSDLDKEVEYSNTSVKEVENTVIKEEKGMVTSNVIYKKMTTTRRAIAKAMVNSKQLSPHVTVFDKVEVSSLVDHRNKFKLIAKEQEIKLTYTAYFVKAIVAVLKRYPDFNAFIKEDTQEIGYRQYYNVGVATDTINGLVVPVIKNADRKNLFEIAKEISGNTEKSERGMLKASDMSDGSMTITNVGAIATGGVWSTPIINQPEVGIVGFGRIDEEFVPDEYRQPILKPVLKISLAFDHRIIDGGTATKLLNDLKKYLGNPDLLLVEG